MAVRRMLHADVIQSDAFLDLPFSTQMLYVQITLAADDDGFFNGARRLSRLIGAGTQDLELLVSRRFLLQFGDVVVVKHWRMANTLKSDRIKPLTYPEIAEKLFIKPNRVYTDHPAEKSENLLEYRNRLLRIPNGIPREGKGKEKKRKEMKRVEVEADGIQTATAAAQEQLKKLEGKLGKGVLMLTESQIGDLLGKMGLDCFDYYTDKLSTFILDHQAKVRNHYLTILRWWQEDSLREEK